MKRKPGELTKYVAEIIAARWIRMTENTDKHSRCDRVKRVNHLHKQ